MKIARNSLSSFDFNGLNIADYTSGKDTSSSLAEITVSPGVEHAKAHSGRSDKYYYVLTGWLQFYADEESFELHEGDLCVILKGQRFSYRNASTETAKILLIHTPAFELESEVFDK